MKKILWVSRHSMAPVQLGVLRRLFGEDVEVVADPRPFDNAETVVRRFRDGGYDDLIVVVPLSVLAKMTELGVRPLWAEAAVVADRSRADWITNGRPYRFVRLRRVKRLVLEFDELGPDAVRREED